MTRAKAVMMNPADNTATVVGLVEAASDVIMESCGQQLKIHVSEKIPFGHKFAVQDIPKGGLIVKYGETIGIATQNIKTGQHVHIHNLESGRGRGDK